MEGLADNVERQSGHSQHFMKSLFDPLASPRRETSSTPRRPSQNRLCEGPWTGPRPNVEAPWQTWTPKRPAALQVAVDKYSLRRPEHYDHVAEINRLRSPCQGQHPLLHAGDLDLRALRPAIFSRLYNLDVPVFDHNTTVDFAEGGAMAAIDVSHRTIDVALPPPTLRDHPLKLHRVAEDLETLLGFKGNYMIFPITNFDNYMVWFMMQNYIHVDDINGVTAVDPDPGADLTLDDLRTALEAIHVKNPDSFANNVTAFEEIMVHLISKGTPELVIVPSESLYIEALQGTLPCSRTTNSSTALLTSSGSKRTRARPNSRTCAWPPDWRVPNSATRTSTRSCSFKTVTRSRSTLGQHLELRRGPAAPRTVAI